MKIRMDVLLANLLVAKKRLQASAKVYDAKFHL